MAKIGKNLQDARIDASLSMDAAAAALEISRVTLSRYENDWRDPDAETLARMGHVYKCDVNRLLNGSGAAPRIDKVPVAGTVITNEEFELSDGPYKEFLPIYAEEGVVAVEVLGSSLGSVAYHGEYLLIKRAPAQKERLVFAAHSADVMQQKSAGEIVGTYRRPRGT